MIFCGEYTVSIITLFTVPAFVARFEITGFENIKTVVKREGDPVTFQCEVSGRPMSNIKILYENSERSSILVNNYLIYQIPKSSCSDTGVYSCEASNEASKSVSTASVHYFVQCKCLSIRFSHIALKPYWRCVLQRYNTIIAMQFWNTQRNENIIKLHLCYTKFTL